MAARRIVVLADDLIWSTRLAAAVRAIGDEPVAARTIPALVEALAAGADRAIVDLTARTYDGIAAVGSAVAGGATVLAVGQHDDIDLRRRALAAGAGRVLAYRALVGEAGAAALARWTAAPPVAGRP